MVVEATQDLFGVAFSFADKFSFAQKDCGPPRSARARQFLQPFTPTRSSGNAHVRYEMMHSLLRTELPVSQLLQMLLLR